MLFFAFMYGVPIINFIISVFLEATILTVLKWGVFRTSFSNSIFMNAISVTISLLVMEDSPMPTLRWEWGMVFFASVLIEGLYLQYITKGIPHLSWRVAFLANFISYVFIWLSWRAFMILIQ